MFNRNDPPWSVVQPVLLNTCGKYRKSTCSRLEKVPVQFAVHRHEKYHQLYRYFSNCSTGSVEHFPLSRYFATIRISLAFRKSGVLVWRKKGQNTYIVPGSSRIIDFAFLIEKYIVSFWRPLASSNRCMKWRQAPSFFHWPVRAEAIPNSKKVCIIELRISVSKSTTARWKWKLHTEIAYKYPCNEKTSLCHISQVKTSTEKIFKQNNF